MEFLISYWTKEKFCKHFYKKKKKMTILVELWKKEEGYTLSEFQTTEKFLMLQKIFF